MREMLLTQAALNGHPIPCALCSHKILPGDKTIREHMHALGLGGFDVPDNWRLVHKPCARRKTIGTKATSAGSDTQLMAKHRRLTGKNKPKRKREIQSRGFDKRYSRPVNGPARRREEG